MRYFYWKQQVHWAARWNRGLLVKAPKNKVMLIRKIHRVYLENGTWKSLLYLDSSKFGWFLFPDHIVILCNIIFEYFKKCEHILFTRAGSTTPRWSSPPTWWTQLPRCHQRLRACHTMDCCVGLAALAGRARWNTSGHSVQRFPLFRFRKGGQAFMYSSLFHRTSHLITRLYPLVIVTGCSFSCFWDRCCWCRDRNCRSL